MQRKRSWILGAGAAVVATAATVAAVAVLSDDTTGGPDNAGPAVSVSPSPDGKPSADESPTATDQPSPTEPAASDIKTVPVYYVGDTSRGPRLYREFHRVRTSAPLVAAVDEAVAGDPVDADYRSPWPAGASAADVTYDGDVITVNLEQADVGSSELGLHNRPDGMSEEEAQVAVQQLIFTAQAALQEGRPGVQFLVNGQRTDTLLGVPASEPLAQGDATDVLAQVWIIEPSEGEEVIAPFEVSGLAAAFEANVQWELMQGDRAVQKGFTTAEECCTMAPYSFMVDAPPGDYTLVVHDTDESGGEGFAPWEDTKQVTIVP